MTLGEKIQKFRAAAELSQAQLADALNVSRSAVAKWENGNGMPDIENLKALAAYFHTDVDTLLDETMEQEVPHSSPDPEPRPDTYCGKSCEECDYKEPLGCPGCKNGPGKRFQETCEIAECGRKRNTFECEHCNNHLYCSHIGRAEKIPNIRLEAMQRERLRRERVARQAPFFAKWMLTLFWIGLVSEVSSIMTTDLFADVGSISMTGHVIQFVFLVIKGYVLIRMSKEFRSLFTAGVCTMIAPTGGLLTLLLKDGREASGWMLLLAFVAVIIMFVAKYQEFTSYSAILRDLDSGLADKWNTLWKIYIGSSVGTIVSPFLLIMPLISIPALIFCGVLRIIAAVLYFVYLHHTIKLFTKHAI